MPELVYNIRSSYILVPELVYKQSGFVYNCTRADVYTVLVLIYLYQSWCINSLGSYILVPELVYKQSWFLFTCTRAGV